MCPSCGKSVRKPGGSNKRRRDLWAEGRCYWCGAVIAASSTKDAHSRAQVSKEQVPDKNLGMSVAADSILWRTTLYVELVCTQRIAPPAGLQARVYEALGQSEHRLCARPESDAMPILS